MDRRRELIEAYYRGLPRDRVKVETRRHGFAYLDGLLAAGAAFEYGELTLTGLLHKYKLAHVSGELMERLLGEHLEGSVNLCLYFDPDASDLFCFNLDDNQREGASASAPQVARMAECLRSVLAGLGCPPLVLASGRGYHLWCRLGHAAGGQLIHRFMLQAAARAAAALAGEGWDHTQVKVNFYPDPRTRDIVSLRLFGSRHARTGAFSSVVTAEGTLGEADSWAQFEEHLKHGACPGADFQAAAARLASGFPGPAT